MSRLHMIVSIVACSALVAQAAEGPVIDTFDQMRFNAPKEKGRAELVDGKVGRAIHLTFEKDSKSIFFTSNLRGNADWDKAAGLSFWVKGDGTDAFGGLELIYDDDYAVRYDFAFPIKGTEWKKVTVAWDDFIAVLPGKRSLPLSPAATNKPSKVTAVWLGKWWYWGEYPAHSFAIDEMRLEPVVERDTKDYKPGGLPLKRVHASISAGKPITIVTMGDSLTDTRHWANRKVSWPNLLADSYSSKTRTTIHNPAIGGTQLRENLVLMPLWLDKIPAPDLVTLCFGGNDWDAGMRGEEFYAVCVDAVDRIRRATKGKTDVLILTTIPAASRWETTAELAEACRKAARDRGAGLADTERAFHAAGKEDKNRLYVDDHVHLSPTGHATVAKTVAEAIEQSKDADKSK